MIRHLVRSKVHCATITHCEQPYEGSCAIDGDLLQASDIRENEQICVWNVARGEQFVASAICAERGSGVISLNGSVARHASLGDLIMIAAFGREADSQTEPLVARVVFVDA